MKNDYRSHFLILKNVNFTAQIILSKFKQMMNDYIVQADYYYLNKHDDDGMKISLFFSLYNLSIPFSKISIFIELRYSSKPGEAKWNARRIPWKNVTVSSAKSS